VMRGQRVLAGRTIVAFAQPSPTGRWRVGVTTSRRLRGAVERNRLRRRLREAARTTLLAADGEGAGYDVVLIGRPAAAGLPLSVIEREAARVRARLRDNAPVRGSAP